MNPTCFARYMSKYLTEYLPGIQGVSYNTIASKRDAYIHLLKYLDDTQNIKAEDVNIPLLTRETIIKYLEWLEKSRGSSVSTRNIRLAAIKSLFSYIQTQTPDYIYQCQQIFSNPRKKGPGHTLEYLTVEGIKSVLDAVDASSWEGLRNLTLLSPMYDSAARVQKIADLSVNDFRAEKPSTLRLTGKGSKTRIVPLMSTTSDLVSKYISIYHPSYRGEYNVPLFSNRKKEKLTRAGIAYILKKYIKIAREKQPDLIPETVSPHGLRHSKSMHMLQAGVPLIYIRDFLGHSEISTTEIYYDKQILMTSCPGGYTVLLKYPPEQLSIINASIH